MEKKICKYCKSEIDIDAKICPMCRKRQGKFPVGTLLWIVFFCFLLLLRIFVIPSVKADLEVQKNEGKGADNPQKIGEAYMLVLSRNTPSYMDKYYDRTMNNEEIKATMQEMVQEFAASDFGEINMSGVQYSVGEQYVEGNVTVVEVTISYSEKGFFGGDSIFGNSNVVTIYCHKGPTPEGEKWFIGI